MHGMRGQVELIAIVAFVIIGAIAAYVVLQSAGSDFNQVASGDSDQSKLIKDSVLNLVRTGTLENINKIYDNGGYLDASKVTNIEYGGLNVPVWQACSESMAPDVKREIENGVRAYVADTLKKTPDFFGKNAEFDLSRLDVNARLLDGRVEVDMVLPTKVDNVNLDPNYKVSIPSEITKIISFSEGFVKDAAENKYFETATIAAMARSNPDSEYWMPVSGIISECGKRLIKTRSDLLPAFRKIVMYVMSHVMWNAKPVQSENDIFFPINSAGGETYDLDVEFAYPPSWDDELARRFSNTPETLNVVGRPLIPIVPACMTPYSVSYSFQYPVIISVKDKISDKYFRFAILTSVKNNMPDETCEAGIYSGKTEYEEECIDKGKCEFNITVTDTSGNPIDGANVMFYMCELGRTNSEGQLLSSEYAKAPCLISSLSVYKEGYRTYASLQSGEALDGINVELVKAESEYSVNIMGVPVAASGSLGAGKFSSYKISGQPKPITEFTTDEGNPSLEVMFEFYPIDANYLTGEDISVLLYNRNDSGNFVDTITTDALYPSEFSVAGASTNNVTSNVTGLFNTTFTLNEGEDSVYLYVPIVTSTDSGALKESIDPEEITKINQLSSCLGGGFVSAEKIESVSVGCGF